LVFNQKLTIFIVEKLTVKNFFYHYQLYQNTQ